MGGAPTRGGAYLRGPDSQTNTKKYEKWDGQHPWPPTAACAPREAVPCHCGGEGRRVGATQRQGQRVEAADLYAAADGIGGGTVGGIRGQLFPYFLKVHTLYEKKIMQPAFQVVFGSPKDGMPMPSCVFDLVKHHLQCAKGILWYFNPINPTALYTFLFKIGSNLRVNSTAQRPRRPAFGDTVKAKEVQGASNCPISFITRQNWANCNFQNNFQQKASTPQ